MVLRLKAWESRSPPILVNQTSLYRDLICIIGTFAFLLALGAGWSSPVARQAHNLKVVGSNPTPATNDIAKAVSFEAAFCVFGIVS